MQTTRNADSKGNGWNPNNASFFVVAVVVAAAAAGTKADFDSSIWTWLSQGASCYSVTWRPVRVG